MKTLVLLSLVMGMFLFQESGFMGPYALLGKVLAGLCLILLVLILWQRKKKDGVDPAIMSSDGGDN